MRKRFRAAGRALRRAAALFASLLMLTPAAPVTAGTCNHLVGKNGCCAGCFTPFQQLPL